jgi:hypothetical protein
VSRYIVDVAGCDETTYVDVELSDEQAEGVRTVAAATVERHWYDCYPVLTITPHESASAYARESAAETRDES